MLLTLFPSAQRTDDDQKLVRAVWLRVLADIPDAALEAATAEYVNSAATFAPAPGMLRTRAVQLVQGDTKTRALAAWAKIEESRYGRDPIDDPLVTEVARLVGGFAAIGGAEIATIHFMRDRFVQLYSDRAARVDALMLVAPEKRAQIESGT